MSLSISASDLVIESGQFFTSSEARGQEGDMCPHLASIEARGLKIESDQP